MENERVDSFHFITDIEFQALDFLREFATICYFCFIFSLGIIAFIVYHSIESPFVIYWILGVFCIVSATLFYRKALPINKRITHRDRMKRGTLVNIVDGVVVASSLSFMPFIDDITRMMIINILIIACAGAVVTTTGYKPFFLGFTMPIMVSIVLTSAASAYFWNGDIQLYFIAIIGVLLTYVLYMLSSGIFKNFKDALIANFKFKSTNEKLRLAIQESVSANESKTRFLASASHDLRQPITTLSLFIGTLSLKPLDDEQKEIVEHMSTAINSIDAQLESLLDISKLDAGVVKVDKTNFDLVPYLKRLVDLYANQQKDCPVQVRFNGNLDHAFVESDKTLFDRIVRNLVGNALKYTENGYVDIGITSSANLATITISDTGIGIDEESLKKVFEEFYQVDNPERDGKNGLGLGLSIVRRLCELLAVEIDMTSESGIGTTVTLTVPCQKFILSDNQPDETRSEQLTLNTSTSKSKNIIALDNEDNILIALKSVLETMGHQVTTFTDSKQALLAFSQDQYDLALIDYRLPGPLKGTDIIREILKKDKNIRCFLVTGDSNIDDDMDDFNIIYKPVTNKKLEQIFKPAPS